MRSDGGLWGKKSQTERKNKGVNTENKDENGAKQENYLRETV